MNSPIIRMCPVMALFQTIVERPPPVASVGRVTGLVINRQTNGPMDKQIYAREGLVCRSEKIGQINSGLTTELDISTIIRGIKGEKITRPDTRPTDAATVGLEGVKVTARIFQGSHNILLT